MGFLNFFRRPDINEGVSLFSQTPDAILLDVRTQEEYQAGHIPQSHNLPVEEIDRAPMRIPDQKTPLFVYCLSGARSSQAAAALRAMGYTQVTNIGGINSYQGKVEYPA